MPDGIAAWHKITIEMFKTRIFVLVCLLLFVISNGSDIYGQWNNVILMQGIDGNGCADLLDFQSLNNDYKNIAITTQIGYGNQSDLIQSRDNDVNAANKGQIFQKGLNNTVSATQDGTDNRIKSYQDGYIQLSRFGCGEILQPQYSSHCNCVCGYFLRYRYVKGEDNELISNQTGSQNGLLSIQQGVCNSATITQTGVNNRLFLFQRGMNNTVEDFQQSNDDMGDVLYESIIQIGYGNSLSVNDNSQCKSYGNSFYQEGTNLSLMYYNGLFNIYNGIGIVQMGSDMKIAIDRSYFLFPID